MKRRTKIVCTLGPAVDSREKIAELIEAGMNVARINCSHGDWDCRKRWIEWIRELSPKLSPPAIMIDLQGPKFRIGDLPDPGLQLTAGQSVTIGDTDCTIPISQPEIIGAMAPGGRLLLGDGEIELRVTARQGGEAQARVVTGGLLTSHKGVTLVGKAFDVPALTDKDREDAIQGLRLGIDILALSYVKCAADVTELRQLADNIDPHVQLCSKIEMRQGIRDLENILRVVDVVMVARGDMGLQMEIEDVPIMQKRIIRECTEAGTPVITATQMLESMINSPRPTRAEASDVANAVLDGTDAIMLSGETSVGKYPIECVRTMARIAERAESSYDRDKIESEFLHRSIVGISQTDAIAHSTVQLAQVLKPAAILTLTTSGQTPRRVSKHRPKASILCATPNERTYRQLAVVWGVEALLVERPKDTDHAIHCAMTCFCAEKRLKMGDMVIITAGIPAGTPGNTNLILTEVVKE